MILAIQAKLFRRLRAESRHAPGEPEFMCLMHDVRWHYTAAAQLVFCNKIGTKLRLRFSRVVSADTQLVAEHLGRPASSRKMASRL